MPPNPVKRRLSPINVIIVVAWKLYTFSIYWKPMRVSSCYLHNPAHTFLVPAKPRRIFYYGCSKWLLVRSALVEEDCTDLYAGSM